MSNWIQLASLPAAITRVPAKRFAIFRKSFPLIGAAVAFGLGGCDVQLHDDTPTSYPANQQVGMYEVKADVTTGMLAGGDTVHVFMVDGKQRTELLADAKKTHWQRMVPLHCQSSFPLQYLVVWNVGGVSMQQKLVPQQPKQVQLTPPPLTKEATVDTTAKSTKGWPGTVSYTFVTAEHTQITGAHVEPVSQDPADVAAANAITVDSMFPVDAPCGVATDVRLTSKQQKAKGNLVIDTDMPAFPHWTTHVEFAPH
ncbi:MAG TPA: hypothetical protein VGM84_22810 [Steroidobacteraceae bacterium]|jgi:hypothetical protein